MSWNHRIMSHEEKIKGKTHVSYGLHEVFYGPKKKLSWTEDSMIGYFESKEELISVLEMMLADSKKKRPILKFK